MRKLPCEPEEPHFASGLSEDQLRRLHLLGQEVAFDENELMVVEGEHSTMFYLLLSGSASVEVANDFCTISIQALSPGDAFGWSSLLLHHDTMFQVRSREPCIALRLPGSAVSELCRVEPALGVTLLQRVLQTVAGRVRGLELRLIDFCGLTKDPGTSSV